MIVLSRKRGATEMNTVESGSNSFPIFSFKKLNSLGFVYLNTDYTFLTFSNFAIEKYIEILLKIQRY